MHLIPVASCAKLKTCLCRNEIALDAASSRASSGNAKVSWEYVDFHAIRTPAELSGQLQKLVTVQSANG